MKHNEMLAFRTGATEWVMPVGDVAEIVESPRVVKLPLLTGEMPGVISLRGEAVPAIEIQPPVEFVARRSAIVTRGGRRVALLVDAVDGIVEDIPEGASVLDVAALLEGPSA